METPFRLVATICEALLRNLPAIRTCSCCFVRFSSHRSGAASGSEAFFNVDPILGRFIQVLHSTSLTGQHDRGMNELPKPLHYNPSSYNLDLICARWWLRREKPGDLSAT